MEMDRREIKNGTLAQCGECRSLGLMKSICTYSSLTPLIDHLSLSPDADKQVRDEAERRAKDPNQPRYDFLGNDCWDYATGMYYYGIGAQIRSNMQN